LFSHAIARFITHPKTVPPLCISIQAPWGQGKTSLMRMVQEDLDKDAVREVLKESRSVQLQRKIRQHKVKLEQIIGKDKKLVKSNVNLEKVAKEFEELSEFRSIDVIGNEEDEVEPRLTVWFNAWAYENTEQVWSGLADSIVQQTAERLDPEESTRFLLGLHMRRHGIDRIVQRVNKRVSLKWWHNIRTHTK
jgi:ATPase subunit of ABC transporter with duplicated ATPase domains